MKITHKDIIKLCSERYCNEKQIKKYDSFDATKLQNIINQIHPDHLELVYNAILANNIQFSADRTRYCRREVIDENGRMRTKVFAPIDENESDTFFHELGHAVNYCLSEEAGGYYDLLGIRYDGELSLGSILSSELEKNGKVIKEQILDAHRQAVAEQLGVEVYDSLAENAKTVKEFLKLQRQVGGLCGFAFPSEKRKNSPNYQVYRDRLNQIKEEVFGKAMIANRNKLMCCDAHKKFVEDNCAVLDALSSVYDMDYPYALQIHTEKYYKKSPTHQLDELWANLFEIKIVENKERIANFKKYMPVTYGIFELAFEKIKEFYHFRQALNVA